MRPLFHSLLAVLLLPLALSAAESVPHAGTAVPLTVAVSHEDDYVKLVKTLNPSLAGNESILGKNSFVAPASEQARESRSLAWLTFLVFLPFLVLPQVLLVVAIIRFRDRKDGRKPATFVHNGKLELAWTAIPVLALCIVGVPATIELYRVDNPPEDMASRDPLEVKAIAYQFGWRWSYPDEHLQIELPDTRLPPRGQEPMLFVKDRTVRIRFQAVDVNHAWSVPAFGVRKDCFVAPRENWAWFTPDTSGAFEGQCFELCGAGHGLMLFDAVVTDQATFDRWVAFRRHKLACDELVALLATGQDADAAMAVKAYLAGGIDRHARIDALRYWAALDVVAGEVNATKAKKDPYDINMGTIRRMKLNDLITAAVAELDRPAAEAVAAHSTTGDLP